MEKEAKKAWLERKGIVREESCGGGTQQSAKDTPRWPGKGRVGPGQHAVREAANHTMELEEGSTASAETGRWMTWPKAKGIGG